MESYIWHSLAVANGNGHIEEQCRDDVMRKLTPADISAAQKEAAKRHKNISKR